MCWYLVDPETGRRLRRIARPPRGGGEGVYVHGAHGDALFAPAWDFHEFLAGWPVRPPADDLAAFVLGGEVPDSFRGFPRRPLRAHRTAFAAFWNAVDDDYRAFLARPASRTERYWTAHGDLRRMAIGAEEFYRNKSVVREEWHLPDAHPPEGGGLRWARLRLFDDGTADVWNDTGLKGFDGEAVARRYLCEGRYAAAVPPHPRPPVARADGPRQRFRYFGDW